MSRFTVGSLVATIAIFCSSCNGPSASPSSVPSIAAPSASSPVRPNPESTIARTDAPEHTTAATLPLRTEVEVNRPIVDRLGVPSDLFDIDWWTESGDAGQVGTTAQIGLPANERILTVASHLVVSAKSSSADYFARADLIVRDIRSGAVVAEIPTTVGAPVAALIGNRLFWAGMDPISDGAGRVIDGGVWTTELSNGAALAVIPAGEDLSQLGSAGRGPLIQSPSGKTLASVVGGFGGRFTDIIDVSTLAVRTRLSGEAVSSLTDAVAIVSDEPPTDGPRGWVKALDITSGSMLWRFPSLAKRNEMNVWGFRALGSTFIGQFDRGNGDNVEFVVARFDPRNGHSEELLSQPEDPGSRILFLIPSLIGDHHVGLGEGTSLSDLVLEPGSAASILDLETGEVDRNAFAIDTPWLCYPEYCTRD